MADDFKPEPRANAAQVLQPVISSLVDKGVNPQDISGQVEDYYGGLGEDQLASAAELQGRLEGLAPSDNSAPLTMADLGDDIDAPPVPPISAGQVEDELDYPDYQDNLGAVAEKPQDDVQSSLYAVKDINPDEYAGHRQIAEKLAVPVDQVAADPEEAKVQAQFGDNEYFENMRSNNPVLSGLMAEDREAAIIMQDDVPELSGITGWFKAVGRKAGGSYEDASGAADVAMRKLITGEEITEDDLAAWDEEAAQEKTDYGYTDPFTDLVFSSAEQFGPLVQSAKGAGVGAGGGALVGAGVGTAFGGLGAGPGAVVGAARGAGVGAAYQSALMEGGFALKEFATMKDENGDRLDPAVARGAATIVGISNGGLEVVGLGFLLKGIPGGDKLVQLATRGAVKTALKDVTVRTAIGNFTKKYAAGITAETATEAGQELFTILGSIAAAQADGDKFDTGTFAENAGRVGEASVQAAKSMILLNAPGPSAGLYRDVKAINKAQADQTRILDLAKGVEASKTTARAPDKLEKLIKLAKKEGDYQHAYVSYDKFNEVFQQNGGKVEDAVLELDIAQEYAEAKATGNPIAIPIEIYAARMIPSQTYKALLDHTKFDANGVTVADATTMQAEYQARIDTEFERASAEMEQDGGEQTVRSQIFSDAFDKLAAIGTPEKQGRKYATLIAARYAATGARSGLDPMQLYQESGIFKGVRRALPESLAATDDVRMRNLIARLQNDESYVVPDNGAQLASDAQAVNDLAALTEQLGIDAATTSPDAIMKAIDAHIARLQPADTEQSLFQKIVNAVTGAEETKAEPLVPSDVNALGFFSKMGRVLSEKLNAQGTPRQYIEQIKAFAAAGQFKPDEAEWSGVYDWLEMMDSMDASAKMPKASLMNFLNKDGFSLEEVGEQMGGVPGVQSITENDFTETDSRYNEPDSGYIEEQAEEYYFKDIFEEMTQRDKDENPDPADRKTEEELKAAAMEEAIEQAEYSARDDEYNYTDTFEYRGDDVGYEIEFDVDRGGGYIGIRIDGTWIDDAHDWPSALRKLRTWLQDKGVTIGESADEPEFEAYTAAGGENYAFYRLRVPKGLVGGTFKQSGHYPEKDVVIHYRTKDRIGPTGEKMLFVEEVQSDLHQAAYKNRLNGGIGYITEVDQERVHREKAAMQIASENEGDTRRAYKAFMDQIEADVVADQLADVAPLSENLARRAIYLFDIYGKNGKKAADFTAEERAEIFATELSGKSHEVFAGGIVKDSPADVNNILVRDFVTRLDAEFSRDPSIRENYQAFVDQYIKTSIDGWQEILDKLEGIGKNPARQFDSKEMPEYRQAIEGIERDKALHKYLKEHAPPVMVRAEEKAKYLVDIFFKNLDQHIELDAARVAAAKEVEALRKTMVDVFNLVPFAPFGKTWRQVALKRLLIKAAQGGFKSIGWTTGTQQNVRYNLSRVIDAMDAKRDGEDFVFVVNGYEIRNALEQAGGNRLLDGNIAVHETKLDDVFGKNAADTIRAQTEDHSKKYSEGFARIDFEAGLEIGGDKKGNLYDSVMPLEFSTVMKKIDKGAKATLTQFDIIESGRNIGKIWHAPISDEAVATIRQGLELFQKNDGVQGSYNRATKAITLFEGADLSTLLHELGHMWLDETKALAERADVNPEIKKDWDKLKAWLGVVDDTIPMTREQHEKFARTFELYLREGKAPSIELQSAFDAFAAWLRRIYQTVQKLAQAAGFNVTINDDIREVFDRMLASSEEIDQMRQQAEYMEDPAIMDMMNSNERADYIEAKRNARERAKSELLARMLRQVEKRRSVEFKEESEAVRDELVESAKTDPTLQVIEALTTGHFIGDPKNEKALPRIKIDRNWFLETYGVKPPIEIVASKTGKTWQVLKNGVKDGQFKDQLAANEYAEKLRKRAKNILPPDLPKHIKKMIAGVGGMHPDQAAQLLAPGTFQSGRQMMDTVMSMPSFKDTIDGQVKQQMDERFPEMLDPASMTEEALKALNNELQADALATEYKAIARRTNHKPFTKEMAQAIAERLLATKKIRDLNGTYSYYRTGLQLAQKVGKALSAKRFEDEVTERDGKKVTTEGAATLKRKQMINHYLYRLSKENEEKVDQTLNYLKKFQRKGVREKIDSGYLDQIDEMLEGYDLRKQSSVKTRNKREGLQEFMKRMEASGTPIDIPAQVIADAFRVSYKDLTLPDFFGMADAVQGIEHLGRLKDKLLKAADQRAFDSVVTECLQEMEAANPDRPDGELAPRLRDKFKKGWDKWHAHHLKMEFLFRFLDGYKDLGATWTAMFKPLADAEAEENTLQAQYIGKLKEIFDGYDTGNAVRLGKFKLLMKPQWIPELQMNLTKDQLLSIALNWGNEYNREALVEGYKGRGWSLDIIQDVLEKHLTEKDWQVVQKIWDLVDSLWPQIEAMEKRLTGMAPEKVEAIPVSTPYGVLRGGYYPVKFDPDANEKAFSRAQKEDKTAVFQDNYTRPATKKGHTKERVGTGGQPLLLSTSVVSGHLYQVIHDLTHREAAIDVLKFISDERIQQAIIKKAGREAYRQLLPWLQRIVNEQRQLEGPVARIFGKVRANATIVTMGVKFTTALQQPLGYLTTTDAIGEKYAAHGLKSFYWLTEDKNPIDNMRAQVDRVNLLSPFMAERSKNFDRDIRAALDRMAKESVVEDWRSSLFYLTQLTQKGVDYPTWLGAYAQGMDELFDADEAKAVDYADSIVRRTQSAGGAKDLAAVQANGEFARLFTMFYSYFSVLYNVAAERTGQFKSGRIGIGKAAASCVYLWFLPVILGAMITGNDPDDDENFAAHYGKLLLAFPFATMVVARDATSVLLEGFDYRMSPVAGALDQIYKGAGAALGAGFTEAELTEGKQKSILYGLGYALGLPTAQVWNSLDYLRDYVNGEKEGFSLYEFVVKKDDK